MVIFMKFIEGMKNDIHDTKNNEVIIDDLYNIIVELDAREISGNCVVDNLIGKSWTELCEEAIGLLEKLK